MRLRSHGFFPLLLTFLLVACGDDETGTGGAGGGNTSTAASTTSGASSSGASVTGAGGSPDASSGTGDGGGGAGTSDGGAGGGAGGSDVEPLEPGLAIVEMAMPIDISSNGRTALIQDQADIEAGVYFYDVEADELAFATSMGSALLDFASGMSDDGVITGLHGDPVEAGVWTEEDDWHDVESPFDEPCDVNVGGAWDVSQDGEVVAGFLYDGCSPRAFLYARSTDDLLMLDILGEPFGGADRPPVNRATVISDDGRVAAGFAENDMLDRSAAVWTDDGAGFLLDPDGQDAPSEVLSISADGSVVAGIYGYDGFRWTEEDGLVVLPRLETALPSDPMFPNAIARDGALVLGGSGDAFSGIPVAFVWSEEAGIRALQDVAVDAGIDVPEGFLFGNVLATSTDGAVILGTGLDEDGFTRSFVLRLPADALDD